MDVTVIGAGVIGLTAAIRLQEAGFGVRIVAADPPLETAASAQAGAIWYPYRSSRDRRAEGWGLTSLEVFWEEALAGGPGLAIRPMIELQPDAVDDPWWSQVARNFRHAEPDELRAGHADGWVIDTVVIDVRPYLSFLVERFEAKGGSIEVDRVVSLRDVPGDVVVNCTGVGAAGVVHDASVVPIRGQVLRVRGTDIDRVTMVERGPLALTYIMPHGDECILGGTTDAGEWDRTPDDAVTAAILGRATALEPSLADAEVVEVRVGLRPGRPVVRVDRDPIDARVIHDYGHAGNGWSLSWGCADEVVRLARQVTS